MVPPLIKHAFPAPVPADTSDQALIGNAAVQASMDKHVLDVRKGSGPQDVGKHVGATKVANTKHSNVYTPAATKQWHDTKLAGDWSGPGDSKLVDDTKLSGPAMAQTKMRRARDLMNKKEVPDDVQKETPWYDRLIYGPDTKIGGQVEPAPTPGVVKAAYDPIKR